MIDTFARIMLSKIKSSGGGGTGEGGISQIIMNGSVLPIENGSVSFNCATPEQIQAINEQINVEGKEIFMVADEPVTEE